MAIGKVQLVIERELALLTFQVRRSAQQVAELLDPDLHEIGASGRLLTRAEMVAEFPTLPGEPSSGDGAIKATDMAGALVSPDLVLLTYVSDRQGRRARRSSLWRRSAGAWRLLHHQGTLVDDV